MKFFLISDKMETLTGMRLGGVDGVLAQTAEQTDAALRAALADPSVGILLITENLARLCAPLLDEIRLGRALPLVVELPDRHGTRRAKDSITRYMRDAIGIKL